MDLVTPDLDEGRRRVGNAICRDERLKGEKK